MDIVLQELAKYRTALAIMLETHEHMPSLDETDIEQLKYVVQELYENIGLEILEEFLK